MRYGGCIALLVLNILLGGKATQYVLNYWLPYVVHHAVSLPFLPCAIAGLFIGEVSVPVAIATWVISFAL